MEWVRSLRTFVVVIGWVAAVWGVAYAVNGATIAPAWVRVPVSLMPDAEQSGWANVAVEVPGVSLADAEPGQWFAGARPGGWETSASSTGLVSGPDGTLTLVAWGSTEVEQVLARGNFLVGGLGILVGALALAPVLGSIADGRPFAPGNSRRLVVVAATIAVAGVVGPMLPQLAGNLVLARTGLAGPRLTGGALPDLEPLLAAAVVLALAAAFRSGEKMADDVQGLV